MLEASPSTEKKLSCDHSNSDLSEQETPKIATKSENDLAAQQAELVNNLLDESSIQSPEVQEAVAIYLNMLKIESSVETTESPLPSPEEMRQYEKIQPGFFLSVLEDLKAVRKLEEIDLNYQYEISKIDYRERFEARRIAAVVILVGLMTCLIGIITVDSKAKITALGIVAGSLLSAFVFAFIYGKKYEKSKNEINEADQD